MLEESERIYISAITQYAYCPRRCMLIHLEGEFEDNAFTLQGSAIHERADQVTTSVEDGKRTDRALPLWSEKLGIQGRGDAVEFFDDGTIRPVEYKRGKRRPEHPDDLQLCAQALCLEEMFSTRISGGAIFYHESRSCRDVVFDEALRNETVEAIGEIRLALGRNSLPPPANDARCGKCSLTNICMPSAICAASKVDAEFAFRIPAEEEGESL
jgi:CRISPR-associated exonuclease Cas4